MPNTPYSTLITIAKLMGVGRDIILLEHHDRKCENIPIVDLQSHVFFIVFTDTDPMLTSSDADLMGSCSDVEGEKVSAGEVGVEVEDVEREVDSPAS